MPVFEGMLPPPHDELVMKLLFTLAFWHGLAKLRLHTEETLAIFHGVTWELGYTTCEFVSTTCDTYDTRELPSEEAARGRRTAALTARKKSSKSKGTAKSSGIVTSGPKVKKLNLKTSKWHTIGDCAYSIPWYGTLDVGNTQTVSAIRRR